LAAVAISAVPARTPVMAPRRRSTVPSRAVSNCPSSSSWRSAKGRVRSPRASASATSTASRTPAISERITSHAMSSVTATTTIAAIAVTSRKRRELAASSLVARSTSALKVGTIASSGLTIFCCTSGHSSSRSACIAAWSSAA